jgi:signal transduction histidine kinase
MLRHLTRQSPWIAFIECLLLLFAISWLDLTAAHEVSLVLFYSGPIVFAVWLCDSKSAFLIAGLAGVLWSWGDVASGHAYSSATVQAWEIGIRFAFFFLVAIAGIATKEQHRASKARIALLEHTQKLEKQIVDVSEHEQQRIGRDLHDGLCPFLAAIRCLTSSLKTELEREPSAHAAAKAGEIEKLLGESVEQARDLAHGLVPVQLNDASLPAALRELAASTSRLCGIDCKFEYAGEDDSAPTSHKIHLYRIAQEAINNAAKHARARNIDIQLSANASALSLSVADDGIGLSRRGKDGDGVGISIMRYRATAMGGELEIEDRSSGGTIVSCTMPLAS